MKTVEKKVKVEYSKNQGFHLNYGNNLPNHEWHELTGYISSDNAFNLIKHLEKELQKNHKISIEEIKDLAIQFLFY